MFNCPTCDNEFSLPEYLEHAKNCGNRGGGGAQQNGEIMISAHDDEDSVPNREEASIGTAASNNQQRIDDFTCPLCLEQFPMAVYAKHAPHCSLARSGGNRGMQKRSEMGTQEEDVRKRSRLTDEFAYAQRAGDCGTGPTMLARPEQQLLQQNGSAQFVAFSPREQLVQHLQPPLPIALNQSHVNNTPLICLSNSSSMNGESGSPSNAFRQGPQARNDLPHRAQEQSFLASGRITAPMSQNPRNVGSPLTATMPNQPQHVVLTPQMLAQLQPINQTPIQVNPGLHARRLKEEMTDGHAGGAAANGQGPVNAGGNAANGPGIGNAQELADIMLRSMMPHLRQLETSINDVRRRVEMFEASMMMKLGAMESAMNRMKDQDHH